MLSLDRVKTLSDIVSSWIGLVALIVGGVFAIVQYLDKEKADRVKTTLEFLQKFNTAPVVDARKAVLSAWAGNNERVALAVTHSASEPDTYPKLVAEIVKAKALYEPLITVIDFYDSLQICVETKLCDSSATTSIFQRDARVFFNVHYPFFIEQRKERVDPAFAEKLQALAMGSKK
jgi:hypothetical protein